MSIAVVVDSTADFAPGERERLGIEMVPLSVIWGADAYRDKVELQTSDFYTMLGQRKDTPTTSAPSPGMFEETFARLAESHDNIVSIHLAGKLSATVRVAEDAARRVAPDRIVVIDSGTTTLCLGWLGVHAATRAAEGAEFGQIVAELRGMVPRFRFTAALDTLEFLRRGGRIGRAGAFIGSLLNFKPILSVHDGEVHPLERPRSRAIATRRIVDITLGLGDIQELFIGHGGSPEARDELVRLFAERAPHLKPHLGEISAVVGVHGGPGVHGAGVLLRS
jgi:DegV family protein with EDD domain